MDKLKAALRYRRLGFSVIPCKENKKPYYAWTEFQRQKPSEEQIKEWWGKYPHANIAIITGEVSGVDVVDCDTEESYQLMNEEFLSDTFMTPVVKTPKGYHIYFKHRPGLSNAVQAINGTDLRTNGGYVIAPPSKNGRGEYTWFDGLAPKDVSFSPMPGYLFDVLQSAIHTNPLASSNEHYIYSTSSSTNCENHAKKNNRLLQVVTSCDNQLQLFSKGSRDDDLFRLANYLIKGGMDYETASNYLYFCAANCSPPFSEKEIPAKLQSAINRSKKREINFADEVRAFVSVTDGDFSVTNSYNELQVVTKEQKAAVRQEIRRLVKDGIIEKTGTKNGVYRKIDTDVDEMDWLNAEMNYVHFWIPLKIGEMAGILPGNIIVVAGSKDSGKTSFLMNIAKENRHKYKVHYFNSEMGPAEFKLRASKFDDIALEQWKGVRLISRSDNFGDVVVPGEGNLNIVDFIEVHDSFYKISEQIKRIHDRLKGAIAVIAIQKNKGTDLGRGGSFSLEKARLYLSLDKGVCKIVSAKNFKEESDVGNPAGYKCNFKLVGGARIIKDIRGWHRDEEDS